MGIKYVFNPTTGNLDATSVETPAGSNTQIQFNDAGSFGGDVDLTWNKTTNVMTVAGDVNLSDGGSFTTTLQTITPTANRTVSIPDATGTLALVAGSSGQLLYNNAGANAGVSTFTADSSGRLTNSASSASGFPVKLWNGTIFAGTTPHVLVQPTGASTPTSTNAWSANGTALAVNTAAGFTGNLLDLQVNGTRALSFSQSGTTGGAIRFNADSYLECNKEGGVNAFNLFLNSGAQFSGSSSQNCFFIKGTRLGFAAAGSNPSVFLQRDDANDTLAQRNGTNAQTFRVYGTESSSLANYVRASLSSSSTAVTLAAETAGTGADDIPLNLTAAGTGTVKVNSNLEIADAKDVVLGTTTGTKIGTATTQKLGFYNKTPVVQPTAVADATDAASVITQLNALLSRMRDLGLIAT